VIVKLNYEVGYFFLSVLRAFFIIQTDPNKNHPAYTLTNTSKRRVKEKKGTQRCQKMYRSMTLHINT